MGRATRNMSKPPSRQRYEDNNPTVAARLPKDKRDKLRSVLQRMDLSLSDLLIKIADDTEIKMKPIEEARRESYSEGYEKAKNTFAVTYTCPKCGSPVIVMRQDTKALASKYLTQHGPGHAKYP